MLLTASLAQSLDSRPQPQTHEIARVVPTRRALVSIATLTAAISAASPSRAELRLPRAARLFDAEAQRAVVSVDVGFATMLLRSSVTALLDWFVAGGYMRSYSVFWGALPSLPDLPGTSAALQSSVSDAGENGVPGRCQIRLNAPADLAGCVALRAEQDGWWLRLVPATLAALFDTAGCTADIDEAFFQDVWQSPSKLSDRILLALGDPAGVVEVPFVPDTLALDVTYSARI